MKLANFFRSSLLTISMCVLLVFLPTASAFAQGPDRSDPYLEAIPYVQFETRSAEPEAVRYLLGDRSSPNMWSLEKRLPNDKASEAGSFRPDRSFSLAGTSSEAMLATLDAKGVRQFDREIVVGTIYEADGSEQYVAALRLDFVVMDGSREVTEAALVPILKGTDLDNLGLVAEELANRVTSRAVPGDVGFKDFAAPAAKSTCRHYCFEDYTTDLNICTAIALACVTAITGVAVGCILACPGTGPLVIPCLIACGVVDVAGLALCLLNEWSCRRTAARTKNSCIRDCGPPIH